jgi:hypothetical protein
MGYQQQSKPGAMQSPGRDMRQPEPERSEARLAPRRDPVNRNTPLRSTLVPRLPGVLRRSLARGYAAPVRRRKVQPEPERALAQAGGNGLGASADQSIFGLSERLPRRIAKHPLKR